KLSNPWHSNHWAVALDGEQPDLQDAIRLFRNGSEISVRDGTLPDVSQAVLMANEFEASSSALEVRNAAERLLNLLNGILFIEEPARRPLRLVGVYEKNPDGTWNAGANFASANVLLRGVKGTGVVSGAATPPQAAWLAEGLDDDIVGDVLTYLRGLPDWFELYKAVETMEQDVERNPKRKRGKPAWPTKTSLRTFKRDSQLHRHSREWCGRKRIPTSNSMRLEDAVTLV